MTENQKRQYFIFAQVSSLWKALSSAQRQTYVDQGPNYPYIDRLGQVRTYTPFQLWCKANLTVADFIDTVLFTLPAPVNLPVTQIQSVLASATPGSLDLDVFSPLSTTVPPDTYYIVEATQEFSGGWIESPKSFFRQIWEMQPGSAIPIDVYLGYTSVFGINAPRVGARFGIRVHAISGLTGQKSLVTGEIAVWS